MTNFAIIAQEWTQNLRENCTHVPETVRASILSWLIGEDTERFEVLNSEQLKIVDQAMQYRLNILQQRYLEVSQERAYRNLIQRLSGHVVVKNKVKTWISLSRDRQQSVLDVIQEVIQEMLNSDRYIQQQLQWIAQCTPDHRLRNAFVMASLEEYCLRPIRNQPLVVFRFVNYLRRSQRGGMTQVPGDEFIRLVSEEICNEDAESTMGSLLDGEAIRYFQDTQDWEEQQLLRNAVKDEFRDYLGQNVNELAVQWLDLHLKGYGQEKIAQTLNVPIKQIYRLREKVSYHAVRVFATKHSPDTVGNWLKTTLQDHSLGLTPSQWTEFQHQLSPAQAKILASMKAGVPSSQIAQQFNLKVDQVLSEWNAIYQLAQALRNQDTPNESLKETPTGNSKAASTDTRNYFDLE